MINIKFLKKETYICSLKFEIMSILERFAIAYKKDGLPPLAGKVMGLLYINDQKHFSFNEIADYIKASKGATSKVIKLLLDLNRINFIYSDENKKKRLFYLDIKGVFSFIELVIENYENQNQLLKESLKLRTNENEEMNNFITASINFNTEVLDELKTKSNKYFKN